MAEIAVTGSVAFDHIMTFPGRFKEHILPEKMHILNVSFLVDSLVRRRGGTASNIAYNLALLGVPSRLVASVGTDFENSRVELEAYGVDTSAVIVVPDEFTASAFITTDLDDNQITGFYVGAMRHAAELSLAALEPRPRLVIVSPNEPAAMVRYPHECRELGIPFVFDPGQQIVRLDADELVRGMSGARCVIGNDYEMALIQQKTGLAAEQLLEHAAMVVITRGADGSTVLERQSVTQVATIPARHVLDPTGAGDAYRAGLLRGLLRDDPPECWGPVASLAATYAVEQHGTQEHRYATAEFADRLAASQACVAMV